MNPSFMRGNGTSYAGGMLVSFSPEVKSAVRRYGGAPHEAHMKKVLLLCFDNPFLPPKEGGKSSMMTRILSLLELDVELDVVLLNKPHEGMADNFRGIDSRVHDICQFVMRKARIRDLFSKHPICVNKRYTDDCVAYLSDKTYDTAIYEGAHMAKYRELNAVHAKRHILYMHDIESAYRAEIARSVGNPVKRYLQKAESRKFRRIERMIDILFDAVMFVSCEERNTLAAESAHPERYVYVPMPAVHYAAAPEKGNRPHTVLYVGDLTLKHNYLSLDWFARKVFAPLRSEVPDAVLRVIGRISDLDKATLSSIDEGIRVLGYVDDLDAEYHNASFFACPMLYGAGVKVKTIDALAQGLPLIGNPKAIEGTALKHETHILIAGTAEEMIAMCRRVLENRPAYDAMAERAYWFVREEHSVKNQARIMETLI